MSDKSISIRCSGADAIRLSELLGMQGKLKSLPEKNYQKLKKIILKYGFSEPISVWKNCGKYWILNGHQRLETLTRLDKEGFEIPEIPINYVQAKSSKEAKEKILALTSQYGVMSLDSLSDFIADNALDLSHDDFVFPELTIPFSPSDHISLDPDRSANVKASKGDIEEDAKIERADLSQLDQTKNEDDICLACGRKL